MTLEERVKAQLGSLIFQLEAVSSKVEELQDVIVEKDKRIAELTSQLSLITLSSEKN